LKSSDKCAKKSLWLRFILLPLIFLLCGAVFPAGIAAAERPDELDRARDPLLGELSDARIIELGQRMYREGILPSGEVMEAYIHEDILVDSRAFSCSSCHLRAGLGSVEGGVVTPPTTGRKLYQPYTRPPSLNDVAEKAGYYTYAKTIIQRPAYTRETLKTALRSGVDPAGIEFNLVMPRYPLDDTDLAILVRYLELLSDDYSPGASQSLLKFATIITDDVNAADREALLSPLRQFVANQNKQVDMYRDFLKFGYKPTGDMKNSFRNATLSVWELKGAAETWEQQLEDYYQQEPVFAVLGGISNQSWQPIDEFCEARQLPCLYPITNFPVVSSSTWYTYYLNKGYYQEGETLARYLLLQQTREGAAPGRLVQLVEESAVGQALAAGFNQTRQMLGLPAVPTVYFNAQQAQNSQTMAELVADSDPDTILLFGGANMLPALPALAALHQGQARLYLSSTALAADSLKIPDSLRPQVFLTFPYRLKPFIGDEQGMGILARVPIETTYTALGRSRVASLTAIMLNQSVMQGLRLLYDNLYRDHLIDTMSMQMDQTVFDYERISFGIGQRYASKGCYVIQLGTGPEPELLPRSTWIVQ
jgi:hypothetical protein